MGLFYFRHARGFSGKAKWRSARAHSSTLKAKSVVQNQPAVAQRAEVTVNQRALMKFACGIVSLIGSHTMLGQHSQLSPTSLSQGLSLIHI